MTVIFSTCWYIFKAKFDPSIYQGWIHNMLSNVNNYHLVVYCDNVSYGFIEPYLKNPRIKAVIKPIEEFSTYGLKELWIDNHSQNILLNQKVDWRLNILWCEKLAFVRQTIRERYFRDLLSSVEKNAICDEAIWYGWCDIGYFRGRSNDSPTSTLTNWPSDEAVDKLDTTKIYYACVNNNQQYVQQLWQFINDRTGKGLPRFPIPDNQISIAGGFFLGKVENLLWWHDTFYSTLSRYFENGRLVKDDQIIVADGVFSNVDRFALCVENDPRYDNWFMFQRTLS